MLVTTNKNGGPFGNFPKIALPSNFSKKSNSNLHFCTFLEDFLTQISFIFNFSAQKFQVGQFWFPKFADFALKIAI